MPLTDRAEPDTVPSVPTIAHDLNNALAIILSNIEFAIEELDPSHPLSFELREIHAAAARAGKLTKQLQRHVVRSPTHRPVRQTVIAGSGFASRLPWY